MARFYEGQDIYSFIVCGLLRAFMDVSNPVQMGFVFGATSRDYPAFPAGINVGNCRPGGGVAPK